MNLIDSAIPFVVSASSSSTIITGVAGKRIYVWRLFLQSAGTVTVTIRDTTVNLCGSLAFVAQSQVYFPLEGYPYSQPWFICTVGNGFVIDVSDAVQISGAGLYSIS